MTALPSHQYITVSLSFLVMLSLSGILLLVLTARLRRTALAEAVTAVSAQLRRLIHRQMYRLGQSSLPTEGTGPVVNLFTREVNDVRDGLYQQLDVAWRMPILVAGLVLSLLMVSPLL